MINKTDGPGLSGMEMSWIETETGEYYSMYPREDLDRVRSGREKVDDIIPQSLASVAEDTVKGILGIYGKSEEMTAYMIAEYMKFFKSKALEMAGEGTLRKVGKLLRNGM